MKQDFRQIIRRSRRKVLLGRIIAWFFDASVLAFLSIIAFTTWAHRGGFAANAWGIFLPALFVVLTVMFVVEIRTGTSMQKVAQTLDEELKFNDRLSSALVFSKRIYQSDFMLAHIHETNEFLENRRNTVLPIPRPQRTKAYVLFLAIVFASALPHEDRARIKTIAKPDKLDRRKHDAMEIVEELRDIRKRSDMAGLTKLRSMVMEVQKAITTQMDIVAPGDPEQAPKSETPVDSSSKKAQDKSSQLPLQNTGAETSDQEPRLSQMASYRPVGRFDSFPAESYSGVFSELDRLIISDDFLTSNELQDLSDHVNDLAAKLGNFGYFKDEQASRPESGPGPQYGQLDPDEADDPFRVGLAPLQYKAFSEFLKRYAAHLGQKVSSNAHLEQVAKKKAKSNRGKILNISAPPPKNGKYSIQSASEKPQGPMIQGKPKQASRVASKVLADGKVSSRQSAENSMKTTGGGTQPGGKGAGIGSGGGPRAPSPKLTPKASGGEYLPLEGKLSDGRSVIQIINSKGKKKLGSLQVSTSGKITYNDVFNGYAQGAQAELAGESVPLQIRDYIRQYFLSIRPKVK